MVLGDIYTRPHIWKGDQGARCCALAPSQLIWKTQTALVLTTEESWVSSIISLIEKKAELRQGRLCPLAASLWVELQQPCFDLQPRLLVT